METEEELLGALLGSHFASRGDSALHDRSLAGLGAAPRLLRGLHYPSSVTPSTPAVSSTLSAPPFLPVPSSVRNDAVANYTLASLPHLFGVSSPFDLHKLVAFLRPHPNRPLIDSLLLGLTEGFWPGHSGDFTTLQDRQPHHSDEDHKFLASTAHEEMEKGWLSEPFSELAEGMGPPQPTFVVRALGRKPRQVVDQSSSGLNDGIDSALTKTTYDTIRELGAIIRFRRLRKEDVQHHTLFKSDVQGAFRNIPVSPYWQLKQIHRIRITEKGRHRWIYYVDRRLSLGGRCSPIIFCTLINCIMFCAKVTLALEFPSIFVDDAFGLDTTGLTYPVSHPKTNETRLVPLQQARILIAWTHVGMPWSWAKQESSDVELVILGHLVNAVEGSVTLPSVKKLEFAATVDAFLSSSFPPLVEWQRIAGYAQWACYTIPLAKFALQPLYDKMQGKSFRRKGIPVSVHVKKHLSWFVAELLAAPPLSFLDPCLDEWDESSADLVIFTDACTNADTTDLPGLGFVAYDIVAGVLGPPLHFFHRSGSTLGDIQFIEGLAVASAINWALHARPYIRRLLIRTDSAPVVYGFDAGSGSEEIRQLVWSTYLQLKPHKIDLRVKHIAGRRNRVADSLSRLHSADLRSAFPGRTQFSLPTWVFGGALE